MKIAVTSQNFRTVTGHAGRARRFLIYDVSPEGEPVEVDRFDLPKELAMHNFRGGGAHPLDGVDVIMTQGFGEGFARRMAMRGIVAATTEKTEPVDAVKAYFSRAETSDHVPAAATCGCGGGHGHHDDGGYAHGHHRHHLHGHHETEGARGPRGRPDARGVAEPEGERSHE